MSGPRVIAFGFALVLACAALCATDAAAQIGGGGSGGGGTRRNQPDPGRSRPPLPDESASPRATDPEGQDAIQLFSRLCVSTRGNREQARGIIGDGDSAIEPIPEPMLRGLESGKPGGIGWIVRMPLGDKILVEFAGDGTCLVRAPRANPQQIEAGFQDLLDQYGASGQFDVRRGGEQTKSFDLPAARDDTDGAGDERHKDAGKLKIHFTLYTMTMPDTGRTAELALATTESRAVQIQATLTYLVRPLTAGAGAR